MSTSPGRLTVHQAAHLGAPNPIIIALLIAGGAIAIGLNVAGSGVTLVGVGIAGAIIVLSRPDAATIIVLFALYSNAAAVAVRFHNVPSVLVVVLPVALVAPLAQRVLIRRERLVLTPGLVWMLAFMVAQVVSAILSAHTDDSLSEIADFAVEGIALFVLVVNVVRTPGMLRGACWSILAAGAFLGALSTYQEITGTYGNAYFGFAQVKNAAGGFFTGAETLLGRTRQPELAGPIGDQNFYAQIMLMLIPIGMARAMAERDRLLRLLALGMTAFVGLGMILTFSRGAALAAIILAVAMVAMRFIRFRHVLIGAVVVAGLTLAVPEYIGRVATVDIIGIASGQDTISDADVSLQSRATENLAAAMVFFDYPIAGVGPGQFPLYYQEYANRIGLEVQLANRQPHTLYLGIAAELGLLGLIAFLGIIATALTGLVRARRAVAAIDPGLSVTLGGLILSLGAFLLTGLFLHLAYARYAWLIIALGFAATAVARDVVQRERRARLSSGP